MGRDSNFSCLTCKKSYYLGYGSAGTWMDTAKSIEEYKLFGNENKGMLKNKNFELCLTDHAGHEFVVWSEDWASEENGNLLIDYNGDMLIEGYSAYERVDLYKDD